MDYKEVEVNENSHIVKPGNIDAISYLAMLDLIGEKSKGYDESLALHIASVNAIATYEENKISKYSIASKSFESYRDSLLDQNMFDMIGLFNWVTESLSVSSKNWNERFMSVEVRDKYLDSDP